MLRRASPSGLGRRGGEGIAALQVRFQGTQSGCFAAGFEPQQLAFEPVENRIKQRPISTLSAKLWLVLP